jgi:hypothetical protein
MKLFLWTNGISESDFADTTNIKMPESSDQHSGGIVVLANDMEEAIKIAKTYPKKPDYLDEEDEWKPWDEDPKDPIVIDLDKPGVIIYCSGDC